ncbi:hypothetical protein BYT27DRAFT_7182923 [Phlegmacium glaucopus]|nr:hypothetical protein BYT27DRAFT_7182923 [Phlegmacium glaucopus]
MSKLTSSIFHKPSPSDSSLLIPSPPESYSDTITPFPPNPANLQDLFNNSFANASPESAGTRLRKSSSIPYHSSSLRDNKEKGQRSGKSLIIVIPPPTLLYDHGNFAHTPPNGPFHRLSEGVTMPLFPSMTTQLAAIAREFNFPSTSGICLYLHHVEDGLTLKPRISDDSWPSIWSYLSDPLGGPNERRPLISGKVEFDIDLRLARWYASWLSSIHRELSDYPAHNFPSTGPLLTHSRGESQATLPEGRPFEFDAAEHSLTQPSEKNRRHVPRTLSLAERFDLVPVRPDVKPSSRLALSPPDVQSTGSQVLSTIVQEEDPEISRDTLDSRVKSWRDSALLIPSPLAAAGQTSLDPENLPNDMAINNELPLASVELKMEDFTWSISSAGPKSCNSPSSVSEAHVPSVHLASRIAGTVCSTPSVCTSFGPDSSESISPMSWHAPSVHMASRLAGSVCTSVSICTSFGPEDDAPFSPFLDIFRVSTPDLAHRFYESVPSTPQTATTWGAPLSYPPSPRCLSPSPSLDLGERSMSVEFEMPLPSFLSHDPSDTAVWPYVWPYINEYSTKSRVPAVVSHDVGTINSTSNYPYLNIYNPIYPHLVIYPTIPGAMTINSQSTPISNSTLDINAGFKIPSAYPSFDIYPAVYPFNLQRIYPSIPVPMTIISQNASDLTRDSPLDIKVEIPCVYPSFCLYPAVYPFNLQRIYPSILVPMTIISQDSSDEPTRDSPLEIKVEISCVYPSFCLYPAVYPFNLQRIYPSILVPMTIISQDSSDEPTRDSPLEIKVEISCVYPSFCLYPAVYPFNLKEIYPTIVRQSDSMEVSEGYPYFNIYPPLGPPFYAHLALYNYHPLSQYPEFRIYHDLPAPSCPIVQDVASEADITQSIHLRKYPIFNIYPAVYPFFDLYPAVEERKEAHAPRYGLNCELSLSTTVESVYPYFNLYPPVYPHLEIYPVYPATMTTLEQDQTVEHRDKWTLSTSIETGYPSFNLYKAIYPHFDIYPIHHAGDWSQENSNLEEQSNEPDLTPTQDLSQPSRLRGCIYPFFNLYPALYPHFDLYPAPGGAIALQPATPKLLRSSCLLPTTVEPLYPTFNLYPAVYPYFDLYLPLPESEIQSPSRLKERQANSRNRLTHSELHAMVMMEKIEPTRLFGHMEGMKKFGDGHLGLDVHGLGNVGSSSSSKIREIPRPVRDRFGGGIKGFPLNAERQTETSPSRKVENTGRSPGRQNSIVWKRIKAFDSSGLRST